ncbi:MAG: glycine-rich domain-containing protein [Brumimicrobium sp.]
MKTLNNKINITIIILSIIFICVSVLIKQNDKATLLSENETFNTQNVFEDKRPSEKFLVSSLGQKNNKATSLKKVRGKGDSQLINNKSHPEEGRFKSELGGEEIINLREENSRTFKNPDGSYSKTSVKGVFHYKDELGRWLTFQNTPTINPYNQRIVEITGTDRPLSINTKNGLNEMYLTKDKSMKWGFTSTMTVIDKNGNNLNKETAVSEIREYEIEENSIVLKNYFNGIDRTQYMNFSELRTDFTINSPLQLPSLAEHVIFEDELILPKGYTLNFYEGNMTHVGWEGNLEIRDENGTPIGGFSSPIIYDAYEGENKEKITEHRISGAYQTIKTNAGYKVKLLVPASWLASNDRVYPITVDPTATNTPPSAAIKLNGAPESNACTTTTSVNLPCGAVVSNTHFQYQITAGGSAPGRMSDQRSRMEGPNGTEASYTPGTGNSTGTMPYNRNSTTILQGITSGNQTFTLRHYNTRCTTTACNPSSSCEHTLVANSWIVTVTYDLFSVDAGPNKTIECSGSVQLEGSANETVSQTTVGTTNSDNSQNGFTNGYYDYSYTRHLYREGELGGAKWIQSIDIYVHNTPSNYTMNNQRIYLKNVGGILQYNTSYNAGSNGANNPDSDNSYSKVYDGTITFNGSGWFTINFSSPFYYSGTGSLELIWENRDGSWNTNYPTFRYHNNWGYNCSVRAFRDGSFPGNYNWGVFSNRYWIRFNSPNTYSWSGGPIVSGENTLTPTVNPTETTTYTLTATSGACTFTDQVTVTVTPLDITGPSTICLGGTINYDAPGELPAGATFPTGGSISTFDNYRIHEFKTSGTFNPQGFAPLNARILVVGGGGGGGANGGGGGGAGGFLDQAGINIAASTNVVVGAGGAPHNNVSPPNTAATNGSHSAFGTYTAGGGGGGASRDFGVGGQNGGTGTIQGSGGGGGGATGTPRNSAGTGFRNGGNGTLGKGCLSSGGGGGGSNGNGTHGTDGNTPKGGDGGAGTLSNITGTPSYYAGGGGGGYTGFVGCGTFVSGTRGAGGSGVGGGSNGAPKANTGSGGGGGNGGSGGEAQKGADGVVIVRYAVPKWSVTNGTGSATIDEITGELTPVAAGTVTVTFTNANGCEVSKVITISESSTPPTASTGGGNYCHGNNITLTQNGGTDGTGAVNVWYAASGETSPNPNSCDNESYIELWNDFKYNDPTCEYLHRNTSYSTSNGILQLETINTDTDTDPFIWMYPLVGNATIDANTYEYVNVRYKITNLNPATYPTFRMGVLFTKENGCGVNPYPFTQPGAGSKLNIFDTDNNVWHTVSFKMSDDANWNGTITGLRFDYFDKVGSNSVHNIPIGSKMEVDFIIVSKHPMIGEGTSITLSPGDEYYPTETTTYYAKKIDNCGTTSCVNETVVLPPIGTTLSNNNESATCVVNANEFIHFYHTSGRFLGSINANGGNLGNVTMTTFVGAPAYMEDCNQPGHSSFHTAYMGRRWIMNSDIYTNGSDFGNNVSVRLPYNNSELVALNNFAQTDTPNNPFDGGTIDPSATRQNMMLTKITGATEDGNATQADCASTIRGIPNGGNGINPQGIANTQYIDFSIQQFSEFFLHKHQDNSPLPVELTNLSASCNKEVQINWTTASEKNSERFVVEKSRDGQTWTFVSEEQAAGNSTTTVSYTVIDTQPSGGISYYRLRQIDFDGEEEVFGPISVSCDGISNSMVVYPNPNDGDFIVEITTDKAISDAELQLFDITGKIISAQHLQIPEGITQVSIDKKAYLKPGTYVLKVIADVYFEPVKIVVK